MIEPWTPDFGKPFVLAEAGLWPDVLAAMQLAESRLLVVVRTRFEASTMARCGDVEWVDKPCSHLNMPARSVVTLERFIRIKGKLSSETVCVTTDWRMLANPRSKVCRRLRSFRGRLLCVSSAPLNTDTPLHTLAISLVGYSAARSVRAAFDRAMNRHGYSKWPQTKFNETDRKQMFEAFETFITKPSLKDPEHMTYPELELPETSVREKPPVIPADMTADEAVIYAGIVTLCRLSHQASAKWYRDPATGEPVVRNFGEVVALMHSELSEALEADRKGLMDDKLPHRPGQEVEFGDTVLRITDTCGHRGYDLAGAIIEKMRFNNVRKDHTDEARKAAGGKAY